MLSEWQAKSIPQRMLGVQELMSGNERKQLRNGKWNWLSSEYMERIKQWTTSGAGSPAPQASMNFKLKFNLKWMLASWNGMKSSNWNWLMKCNGSEAAAKAWNGLYGWLRSLLIAFHCFSFGSAGIIVI